MAKPNVTYAKRAALAALAAAAPLGGVPAERIYPPQRPANVVWPFIGYGVPITTPFGATCLDGTDIEVAVHAYAETTGEGVATVEGEDAAQAIIDAIEAALDGATLELAPHGSPHPATAHFTLLGSQVIQDGAEADKFHGFARFRITVSS